MSLHKDYLIRIQYSVVKDHEHFIIEGALPFPTFDYIITQNTNIVKPHPHQGDCVLMRADKALLDNLLSFIYVHICVITITIIITICK